MHVELASEVGLQLINRETLVVDDALDQIANRDDTHNSFILNDRRRRGIRHAYLLR